MNPYWLLLIVPVSAAVGAGLLFLYVMLATWSLEEKLKDEEWY